MLVCRYGNSGWSTQLEKLAFKKVEGQVTFSGGRKLNDIQKKDLKAMDEIKLVGDGTRNIAIFIK